ncbi:MAG: hypothetical protein RTU63_05580 [Candidatus Thorarchaeota archaeon]
MGDFEQGTIEESVIHNPKARLKSVIILVLGIFAPVMATLMLWDIVPEISLQSMFWMWRQTPYDISFYGFTLLDPYMLTSMWPFLLLRMAPVSMMYRYYTEKTTRKRAVIASCVGDGIFILVSIPMVFSSIMFAGWYYYFPLPIQMIVAILILWRSPLPEPTTPWEDTLETKSWWEKSPESEQQKPEKTSGSQQKKPADDDDELW